MIIIGATYVVLAGLIVYLLVALHSHRSECSVDVKDTALGYEELQKHAAQIARNHPVGKSKSLNWLVRRLSDNFTLIAGVYRILNKDAEDSYSAAPAAEWLMDNFYIIEEQVKIIKRNLSRGRYSRLPVLTKGYYKGYPRVYAIALEIIAHSNGTIDEKTITSFIQSYQSQVLLSMGELWAIPLMLRIALIESICNTCQAIRTSRNEWYRAEGLVRQIGIKGTDEHTINAILLAVLDKGTVTSAFVEHLIRRLRKQGKVLTTVTSLLDRYLEQDDTTTEKMSAAEHQIQAEMQVAIGDSITGLRLISELDWSELFEILSRTEHILRGDPKGVYSLMDFESRDYYRHEVERLSRSLGVSETHVADKAVECAKQGAQKGEGPQGHVGFYLVGKGRRYLFNQICIVNGNKRRIYFTYSKKPKTLYVGMVLFIMVFFVTYLMYYAGTHDNTHSPLWLIITALLVIIPCSELALGLSNTLVGYIYSPTMLPKLELKSGIPGDKASFVIIPVLLTSPSRAIELVSQMEVYFLANREANLFFALIGDFKDSDVEKRDDDEAIVQAAIDGINELNRKYSPEGLAIFHYFHRSRVYNRSQERWMGWERKRGAIVEFNRLIGRNGETGFSIMTSDMTALPRIKYIITLDADTCLPMGAAKKLIGTIAHPLNKAVVDETTGIVREGYGILQPRISVSIPAANKSFFTRVFAGQGGIDPYTTAVSDIYQDIYEDGSFTGKGIYDLDIFTRVLHDRIPDNTVLSHDLIEGCHLRAGLISDIELVDGYPSSYKSYTARQHRWTRGDWQITPWLGRYVRNRAGEKIPNNISSLSRWKIIDNLRRSLLYPSLFLLFLLGIILLPGDDLVWMGFVLLVVALPLIGSFLNSLMAGTIRLKNGKAGSEVMSEIKAALYQSLFLFLFIPYQTCLTLDAIIRTLYRMLHSRKNMLEWVTAADAEANADNSLVSYYKKMWFSIPAAVIVVFSAAFVSSLGLIFAIAAAVAWVTAPLVAYYISRPVVKKQSRLTDSDNAFLRRVSRKTWRYFEDFSTEEENYLPPDNYQQDPPKGIAHRTSPTNIGLMLISVLSAYDLGYIGSDSMAEILEKTVGSMERLEKWNGHLFNWYNTTTLERLRPFYVSTVDSGNLVGYMMVMKEGLKEYTANRLIRNVMALGLIDTIELMCENNMSEPDRKLLDLLWELASTERVDIRCWESTLAGLEAWLEALPEDKRYGNDGWGLKLHHMVNQFSSELSSYYPFLRKLDVIEALQHCDASISQGIYMAASPVELMSLYEKAAMLLESERSKDGHSNKGMSLVLRQGADHIRGMIGRYEELIDSASKLIDAMEFSPLFDRKRLLFSIGYNVEDGHLSKSYYDLLASEARQASFIAIARGEVDRKHWMRLGRRLIASEGGKGLVSWTGTMFEYLMPLIVIRSYDNTILDETYSFVVKKQRKYCRHRGIPWGISESGYSALDFGLNYQYKAFGVPELGLKRGLANDKVISPYASLLAIGIDPIAVVENLKMLRRIGMEGICGFYEAVDFTTSRMSKNSSYQVVRSFMAHHQGMSLAALNNFFNDDILQKRFHINPVMRSAELLLQEKMPTNVFYSKGYKEEGINRARKQEHIDGAAVRTYGQPETIPPNVHLLSNGEYSVMITDAGSGRSLYGNMAVNRWSPDYFNKKGFYIFVGNTNSNTSWSATYEPFGNKPDKYKVVFSPDKAEFIRKNGNIESHLEVTVSPEDSAEIRRISITNHSSAVRYVELTSFFEAVIAPAQEDAAHPAFSKLFVSTEFVRKHMCLLGVRRQRVAGQPSSWLVHTMCVEGNHGVGELQHETDRMKFIGRNRDITNPVAMEPDHPLSGSTGSVLDPVMSLRRRVKIEAGKTVRAVFTVGIANSRKHAIEMAEKYSDFRGSERAFELSWTRSQVESRYLGLKLEETNFYLELASFLIYRSSAKKDYSEQILANTGSVQELWSFGISGDLPLILVEVNEVDDTELVEWVLNGHEYWRMKSLIADIVILINKVEGYNKPLNDMVRNAVAASHAREMINKPGGVFILNSADFDQNQTCLLYTAAVLVIKESIEAFKSSIKSSVITAEPMASANTCNDVEGFCQTSGYGKEDSQLLFFNGIGGFAENGREYVIRLENGQHTPLPWSNIIANKLFGFIVTESGGGYTWYKNSREFKLTPWANDPVSDRQGEIFYVCDIEEKCHWSLTPMPAPGNCAYTVSHGPGYSIFEHESNGIVQTLTVFASLEQPVKISIVTLKNLTGRQRKLSITYYVRPVLGVDDSSTSPFIVTRVDENQILFIENKFSQEFKGISAFMATSAKESTYTCDRTVFIGHGGDLAEPAGMIGNHLSGEIGAGLDPCAAISCIAQPDPKEELVVVFLLGCSADIGKAYDNFKSFANVDGALAELERVKSYWMKKLDLVSLHTPDDSYDVLMNGWLVYQTIACRMWARTGYYQAGGAYGFRDQLQDCMAVLNTCPELSRDQILLHASRQFKEGDVQHWWHAERGKGIRTRYSDDLLWLAYVTSEYVEKTGDESILDERVAFLEGNLLDEGVDEKYEEPWVSEVVENLYEHCVRAIDRSFSVGPHGIPLIGSGDWNDGMNTVGNKGSGESVWLGWFLISILNKFVPLCKRMKDFRRAELYYSKISDLIECIEREAWDGGWYRRAYFDDGTPLGSIRNSECMIDSISQSWSVISGGAKPRRAKEAMAAVENYLVDKEEAIVKLLTPPFDKGDLEPGYIKGYVPGVRENGGQYTHAATWVVLAFTRLGMGDKAGEIFHMLNPINHTRTDIEYSRYKTEPYVMAADVYTVSPHTGRGGWSWYTGAAGWLYKVGLENIAGFIKKGERLYINPCIPSTWGRYEINYRYNESTFFIEVKNPDNVSCGVSRIIFDGKMCSAGFIDLSIAGHHNVEVIMGAPFHLVPESEANAAHFSAGKQLS